MLSGYHDLKIEPAEILWASNHCGFQFVGAKLRAMFHGFRSYLAIIAFQDDTSVMATPFAPTIRHSGDIVRRAGSAPWRR